MKTAGKLPEKAGMSSSRPALLSLERVVAGQTVETELSQVKANLCHGAVLFYHEGSEGLAHALSKAVVPSAVWGLQPILHRSLVQWVLCSL